MATIRAYTTIEQSRKLAEFLPLESADMHYGEYCVSGEHYPIPNCDDDYYGQCCWSLAALLELLPKRIEIVDNVYELSVYLYGIYYWNITNGNLCFESKDKDNFVDACYEAIVFLHEQKISLYRMNKK